MGLTAVTGVQVARTDTGLSKVKVREASWELMSPLHPAKAYVRPAVRVGAVQRFRQCWLALGEWVSGGLRAPEGHPQ